MGGLRIHTDSGRVVSVNSRCFAGFLASHLPGLQPSLLLARVHGGEVARPGLWDGVYAKAFIDSAATVVPDIR